MLKDQILALQVMAAMFIDDIRNSEKGQASAEYAGIIFVVILIAAALAAGASDIGNAIVTRITEAINNM